MPLGTKVGVDTGDIVLDWNQAPPKREYSPPPQKKFFLAHVCCGQMAGLVKTSLCTEVGLGPGDIVLDGDAAPPKNGHSPPLFGPCLL